MTKWNKIMIYNHSMKLHVNKSKRISNLINNWIIFSSWKQKHYTGQDSLIITTSSQLIQPLLCKPSPYSTRHKYQIG